MTAARERGQATLELALCLPVVVILAGAVVVTGLIVADNARVWHAAREGARIAAVDSDAGAVRRAAELSGLRGLELAVTPGAEERVAGEPVTVTVRYRPDLPIPVLGRLFHALVLDARAAMAIEVP